MEQQNNKLGILSAIVLILMFAALVACTWFDRVWNVRDHMEMRVGIRQFGEF